MKTETLLTITTEEIRNHAVKIVGEEKADLFVQILDVVKTDANESLFLPEQECDKENGVFLRVTGEAIVGLVSNALVDFTTGELITEALESGDIEEFEEKYREENDVLKILEELFG